MGTPLPVERNTSSDVAYARESELYRKFKELVDDDSLTEEERQKHFKKLVKQYGRLLDDVKLLTSVGDRLQRKLKSANMMLQEQSEEIRQMNDNLQQTNDELKLTIDELTRARAGRKAQTFIFIVVVVLFVISENIESFLDDLFGESLQGQIISWSLKIGLVLLLKPLETLIERYMIRSTMNQKRRRMLDNHVQNDAQSNWGVASSGSSDE